MVAIPALHAEHSMWDLRQTDVARASFVNVEYVGVTSAEVAAKNLDDEDGFDDKNPLRRTVRTP